MSKLWDYRLTSIEGRNLSLADYAGKAVLVVNVASKCGLTPQYRGLESLYREFHDQGLVVLGLPCNQFMNQEPGTEAEIQTFCSTKYDVTFPLTAKVEVNGPGRIPLYTWLAGEDSPYPGPIKWNFEKFLINRQGELVGRFSPQTTPDAPELREAIEQVLG